VTLRTIRTRKSGVAKACPEGPRVKNFIAPSRFLPLRSRPV
jgi:hypothetical protein